MHLKVPKAASTTIFDILYSLAPRNRFAVNSRPFYIDETRPRRAASEFVEYLDSLEKRTAHTAHGPYMDFRISSLQQERLPAYVALVRDPVKRLESHYNYLHWGPRSAWAKFWKGQDTSAPSFQSCVEDAAVLTGGEGEKLLSLPRSRRESKGDCLYWANAQLAYFCGLNCNHLDITYRRAGNHSLKKALANIERDFVAVGLVEDIDHSLRLFQSLLPSFFDGAPERGGGLVARATKPQAATGTTSSPGNKSIHTFLADAVMPHEYGLYDEVKRKFQGQLVACGLSSR